MAAKRYDIEGELLTFGQIRKRVPDVVKLDTLRKRLGAYQRRTWATLCEAPNHRPRPEDRTPPVHDHCPHIYKPARCPDVLDGLLGVWA